MKTAGTPAPNIWSPWQPPFSYSSAGTQIYDTRGNRMVDMRGWGFLTGKGSGALGMPQDKAEVLQDKLGEQVALAINSYQPVPATIPQQVQEAVAAVQQQVIEASDIQRRAREEGICRDCADADGTCPTTGAPCDAFEDALSKLRETDYVPRTFHKWKVDELRKRIATLEKELRNAKKQP